MKYFLPSSIACLGTGSLLAAQLVIHYFNLKDTSVDHEDQTLYSVYACLAYMLSVGLLLLLLARYANKLYWLECLAITTWALAESFLGFAYFLDLVFSISQCGRTHCNVAQFTLSWILVFFVLSMHFVAAFLVLIGLTQEPEEIRRGQRPVLERV